MTPVPGFVRPVRVAAAEPEAERRSGRAPLHEVVKAFELGAGRVSRPAAGLELPGAPAFSGEADRVAGALQQIRIDGVRAWQRSPEIAAFLQPMDRLARQERRARRGARRRRRESMRKASALAGDAIEVRRADGAVAVGAGMWERPVVGDRQHDVRTCRVRAWRLRLILARRPIACERERQDERHEEGRGAWHGAFSHEQLHNRPCL